jgi:RNA-binding proteins (RRM domain)
MNIYVGNMPYAMSEEELKAAFAAYGNVTSVRLVTDRETGRAKGFGFVEMPEAAEATAAIEAMNGNMQGGRALVVNEARPREDKPRGERRGGFGGPRGERRGGFGGPRGERRGGFGGDRNDNF